MADNKSFDPDPVVLDHLADALRDLCIALAETEVAPWVLPDRTANAETEDDQLGVLAILL